MEERTENLNDVLRGERDEVETEFARLVDTMAAIAGTFASPDAATRLRDQLDRLRTEQLDVMVVGRFKVGKSTLLNALLTSSSMSAPATAALGLDDTTGPLPVDNLPCTAVLTRIVHAEEPYVRAFPFEGGPEDWSFADYVAKARIYGEGGDAESPLERIRSFEIGLPVALLRYGLRLTDSPGISEDPRRTALTREALSKVHAALVMGRSDMLFGMDELSFISEVLGQTGHAFPVVNMFHGQTVSDRFKAVLTERLAGVRAAEDGDKLDPHTHFVDCAQAFQGYARGDRDLVARSGIIDLERRLGDFLIHGAYHAKVRGVVNAVERLGVMLDGQLEQQRIALQGERESVLKALEDCRKDMQEIHRRRREVGRIIERLAERAEAAGADSYRAMCVELFGQLETRFQERPIPSLSTVGGKLSSLVTRKAANEAVGILNDIIQQHVQRWAEAPPPARGLQADLHRVIEDGQRELEEQYDGIEGRLRDITLRIGELDPGYAETTSVISLRDRLIGAGLGFFMLGPIGVAAAVGGVRGTVGAVLGGIAAKAAVALLAGTFGLALSPAIIVGAVLAAMTGGALFGGVFDMEKRIRAKALDLVRPKVMEMMRNQDAIAELTAGIGKGLRDDARTLMSALDYVLDQQEQHLRTLDEASNRSLEDKRDRLAAIGKAQTTLRTLRPALAQLLARTGRGGIAEAA